MFNYALAGRIQDEDGNLGYCNNYRSTENLILPNGNREGKSISVAKGAIIQIQQWPSHLLHAFLAGCIFSAILLIFAFIPALLAARQHDTNSICRLGNKKDEKIATNVYFLKHENRTWSTDELCSIETAARKYPQYNIYMINLLDRLPQNLPEKSLDYEFWNDFKTSLNQNENLLLKPDDSEQIIRIKLVNNISNVRNLDVSVNKFFYRSSISDTIERLNSSEIELAAKFQILWTAPGIAVEPLDIQEIENAQFLFDKDFNSEDSPVNYDAATLSIKSDLQATRVPCQTFIGFLIKEIPRNAKLSRESILNKSIGNFCPRSAENCGIKILQSKEKKLGRQDYTTCPIIENIHQSNG